MRSREFIKEGARPIGGIMTDPQARTVKDPATGGFIPADDFFSKYPDKNKQAWETAVAAALDPEKEKAKRAATQAAHDKEFNQVGWMSPEEQEQYKQLQAKDAAATQAGTRTFGAERFLKQVFAKKAKFKNAENMLKVHWAPATTVEKLVTGKIAKTVELSVLMAKDYAQSLSTRWGAGQHSVGIVLDGYITLAGRGDLGSDQYKTDAVGTRGQQKYSSRPGQLDPTFGQDTSTHNEALIDNWKIKEFIVPADVPEDVVAYLKSTKIPIKPM
jgi:hypothetical protein